MIEHKREGDLLIIVGTDDADRPEIEALAAAALAKLVRVNVFRMVSGAKHLVAAMVPTNHEIHVRGPSGRGRERTPRDAVWRGLARFQAASLATA